jgi:hypothetical protein
MTTKVNQTRERFIIYPTPKGWQVYDKDTEMMVYNSNRRDGMYDSRERAYEAAGRWQDAH